MTGQTTPYLSTLTPLRGIAALFIVVFHCNLAYLPFISTEFTHFVDNSWLWTDFFFVLSGFIMCYVYRSYFADRVTKQKFRKYMSARFARIYPLYFVTTLWAFFVCVFINYYASSLDPFFAEIFDTNGLPLCLLLLQSMHTGYITPPLNTPGWSLSTEWWTYVLFPFILPLFAAMKTRAMIIAALVIGIFFVLLRYVLGPISYMGQGPTLNMLTDFGFLRCVAGFLVGMLVYAFFMSGKGSKIIGSDWFFALAFLGTALAMHTNVIDIVIVGFFPFIILAAIYNGGWVKRLLETKPLQRLGDWSYSIYMVHMPIIFTFIIFKVEKNPGYFADFNNPTDRFPSMRGLYMCILITGLTLGIAALAYRFVEIPARNYLNRLFNSSRATLAGKGVQPN